MNWPRFSKIACWTPVSQLEFEVQHVRDTLYAAHENCYLIAVPHNQRLQKIGDTRFATCLLWAESQGAALRAGLKEIENDRVVAAATPPMEMLLRRDCTTYGPILEFLKLKHGNYMETANYRISDGAQVHRVIDTEIFEFYFRSPSEDWNERPYAILRRLKEG